MIGKNIVSTKATHACCSHPRTCPNIQHNYAVSTRHDTAATACSGKEGSIAIISDHVRDLVT